MSARGKLILSLFGVFLSIVGFYVSNASSFPFVQRLIAPSYASAKEGIERIQKDGSLQAGQPNFAALAEIIENKVAAQNQQVPRSAIVLERLEATGGGIAFGPAASKQTVGLKMTFRAQQQPTQWDLLELADVVEETWKTRSLRWASWLFWLGIVQTVWPLFLEVEPHRGPGATVRASAASDIAPISCATKAPSPNKPLERSGHKLFRVVQRPVTAGRSTVGWLARQK